MGDARFDVLMEYFPSGTTEGEREILGDAFVPASEYAELMTPPQNNPRLLVGKKGTGKSAIIEFSLKLMSKGGVPALVIKPMDVELDAISEGSSVGQVTRIAYTALVRAVARRLGEMAGGLLSAEEKVLYEEAMKGGIRKRDIVERMAGLLPKLAKPYVKHDLSALLPSVNPATREQLESAISKSVVGAGFYLYIDDTDQVAAPDKPGHLNRIWAFILASRTLTERLGLRVVVSLREEIWRRLLYEKAGQRDQADHFLRLVRMLSPSREQIARIVERRLVLAARKANIPFKGPWEPFFEGGAPRMPSSEETSSWADLIVQRSRDRPRDAIQLVNMLAVQAKRDRTSRINDQQFAQVMKVFSQERVDVLGQEVEQECPVIRDVVRTFARIDFDRGSFKASSGTVREHLRKVPTMFATTLHGRVVHCENDAEILDLWRFLWDCGVINARVRDSTQKEGYRHVFPQEDATFVSVARWNEMQGTVWEINPTFRDYLIGVQDEMRRRR